MKESKSKNENKTGDQDPLEPISDAPIYALETKILEQLGKLQNEAE